MSFSTIPVLDLSLARDPKTKPVFLEDLRNALLDVGFLYIENTGIDELLTQDVISQGKAFFDLPEEAKLEIQMKNCASFLGYNKLGNETTAHCTDWREQIDLSTPHAYPLPPNAPRYHNLLAPNQWPRSSLLPHFRPTYERYITDMSHLSREFTSLIAESLLLPPTAFDRFFDADQQHKLKIVKYPDVSQTPSSSSSTPGQDQDQDKDQVANQVAGQGQGVGPHKDSMLTSYLLQVPPHKGLQAQNISGTWIDCPPQPGTLVVAIGQGLESLTHGICKSTTHRVQSPSAGSGPRFSVPFFQGVSYDATFESVHVPCEVREMADARRKKKKMARGEGEGGGGKKDEVEFTFIKGKWKHLGEATLMNRIKSHPDVGERWYPDLLKQIRDEQRQQAVEEQSPQEGKKEEEEGIQRREGKVDTTIIDNDGGDDDDGPMEGRRVETGGGVVAY